jgi:hypothetical protein
MIGTGCEGKEIRARVVEEEGDRLTSPRRGVTGEGRRRRRGRGDLLPLATRSRWVMWARRKTTLLPGRAAFGGRSQK